MNVIDTVRREAVNAEAELFSIVNIDDPATTQVGQAVAWHFKGRGTSDAGVSFSDVEFAKIVGGKDADYFNAAGNADDDGNLVFFTAVDGTLTERMRINSNGYIGLGAWGSAAALDCKLKIGEAGDYCVTSIETYSNAQYSILDIRTSESVTLGALQQTSARTVGRIRFFGVEAGPAWKGIACIESVQEGAGGNAGNLIFYTTPAGGNFSERLRISSTGEVSIGLGATGDCLLHAYAGNSGATISGDVNYLLEDSGDSYSQHLCPDGNTVGVLFGSVADADAGRINYITNATVTSGYMSLYAGGNEILRLFGSANKSSIFYGHVYLPVIASTGAALYGSLNNEDFMFLRVEETYHNLNTFNNTHRITAYYQLTGWEQIAPAPVGFYHGYAHNGAALISQDMYAEFERTDFVQTDFGTPYDVVRKWNINFTGVAAFEIINVAEIQISAPGSSGPQVSAGTNVATLTGRLIVSDVLNIKTYAQDAEPSLVNDGDCCFWKDTNDSNRIYLVYRRGAADQVMAELT
jgi:hypothetical protein